MTKFLRKNRDGGPEVAEKLVREPWDVSSPEIKAIDPDAVAAAFIRRLEIIQQRGKKIALIREAASQDAAWVTQAMLGLLAEASEEIRDLAVRELIRRDDWKTSELYARLDHPPWYAKSACLRLLGLKKDTGAVRHIRTVLDDPNSDVKRAAAWTLGEIGGPEARSLLVRLSRDANRYVRQAAEEAIERVCDFKFC